MKYAKGARAWGVCGRSGFRTLHKNLIRDGYNPGLMVLPEYWEDRHPQEKLRPHADPQAIRNPAPDLDVDNAALSPWETELGFLITDETLNIIQFT